MCTDRQYLTRVHKLEVLKNQIAELEAQAKAVEDSIKESLGEAEKYTTQDGRLSFSWPVITRHSVDSKRLKAEAPEVYSQYLKESSYRGALTWKEVKA